MAVLRNLKNKRFGHLLVINYSHIYTQPCGAKVHYWQVQCDCGKIFAKASPSLTCSRRKESQSCGCAVRQQVSNRFKTHGYKNHSSYGSWSHAMMRCYNVKDKHYKDYGGRGIKVCQEWHDINNFIRDMGERPKGLTLDRINNNQDYSKENCRWATQLQQANNTRANKFIDIDNERMTITHACKLFGIKWISSFYNKSKRQKGYSYQEAFNEYILEKGLRPNYKISCDGPNI